MNKILVPSILFFFLFLPLKIQAESLDNLLDEMVVTEAEYPEEQLTDLAYELREVIDGLSENMENQKIKNQFLILFEEVYKRPLESVEPQTVFVYGDTYRIAHAYAQQGEKEFLRALMEASQGPYGRSTEGGEWINEMLWQTLADQTQLSINVLSELSDDLRNGLMKWVYTAPIHDGFKFSEIDQNLEKTIIPENIQKEVFQMIQVMKDLK